MRYIKLVQRQFMSNTVSTNYVDTHKVTCVFGLAMRLKHFSTYYLWLLIT